MRGAIDTIDTNTVIPAKAGIQKNSLPKGWEKRDLEDVLQVIRGISFNSAEKLMEPGENTVVCLRTANVQENVDWNNLWWVPENFVRRDEQFIKENDILMSNANSYELVGKVSLVRAVPEKATLGAFITMLRAREGADPKFFFYQLRSQRILNEIRSRASTTTNISNVSTGKLKDIPLWVAPLDQQKRIVAKIEELFSHIDAGIDALKKAKQLLKQYRQSVLKAVVTGELTREWREANKDKLEPASQLLRVIEKQRQSVYVEDLKKWNELVKGRKKPAKPKIIEQLSYEELEELPSLPNGWLWVKLWQVATKITDGEHFKPQVQDDGVWFLSAKDVRDEGVSFANPLYISEKTAAKALLRCNPENGDILIVSRGATVGRMCVVNTDKVFCLLGSVILIKVAGGINSKYLMNLMKSSDVNRKISNVSGATAQQAIYLRDIQHVAIPLCSIEEQKEIDRAVNEKADAIIRLGREIDSKLAAVEKNKQSILAAAFSGNLL